MKLRQPFTLLSTFIFALLLTTPSHAESAKYQKAPEFTQKSSEAWINSKPLTLKALTGNVVLLDI